MTPLLTSLYGELVMRNTPDTKTVLSIIIAVAILLLVLIFVSLNTKSTAPLDAGNTAAPAVEITPEPELNAVAPLDEPLTQKIMPQTPSTEETLEQTTLGQASLKTLEDKTVAKQRENIELRDRAAQLEQELQLKMQSLKTEN